MQEQRLAFERRSPCMHGMHAVPAMQVIYQKASIASCLSCLFIFSYPYFGVIVRMAARAIMGWGCHHGERAVIMGWGLCKHEPHPGNASPSCFTCEGTPRHAYDFIPVCER